MVSKEKPSFQIRDIQFYGKMALAPMAGISDSPHRSLAREFGSAWSYTEFTAAEEIVSCREEHLKKIFSFQEKERPIFFQIFGNSVEMITKAALRLERLKPDVIDINMGCSTRKVTHRGAGAGLLKNLKLAGKIIESLRKNCTVPITAKIRIGYDSYNYRETIQVLQDAGIEAISVHGRTKDMGYSGFANWEAIADIKSRAKVPIFGNGDILTHEDAIYKIKTTGVDAVLIGRGAIGNPWIFSFIDKESLPITELYRVSLLHYNRMVGFYGKNLAFQLFKKYLKNYFQGNDSSNWREFLPVTNVEEFEKFWIPYLREESFNSIVNKKAEDFLFFNNPQLV